MANREIENKATGVKSPDGGVGVHVEQRLTYKDAFLPSPEEMKAYMEIDADFCTKIFNAFEKEQEMRHDAVRQGLKLKEVESLRAYRLSWGGIVAALVAITMILGVTVIALKLAYPWIAAMLGAIGVATIVGMFLRKGERKG